MAGYPYVPPGYGAPPYPPFTQDSPPLNQNYYNNPNPYATFQTTPQQPAPQQDLNAPMQHPPALDANQLAYFWNQVQSGNIPPLTPNESLQQGFPFAAPAPAPAPPIQNPFAPAQQSPYASLTTGPAHTIYHAESSAQYPRVEEINRPDKEDGELTSEGEAPRWASTHRQRNGMAETAHDQYNNSSVDPAQHAHANSKKQKARQQQQRAPRSIPTPVKDIQSSTSSNVSTMPTMSSQNHPAPAPAPAQQAQPSGNQRHEPISRASSLRQEATVAISSLLGLGFGDVQLQRELGDDAGSRKLFTELVASTNGRQTVQSALQGRPHLRSLLDDAGMNLNAHSSSAGQSAKKQVMQQLNDIPHSKSEPAGQKASSLYQSEAPLSVKATLIPGLSGGASATKESDDAASSTTNLPTAQPTGEQLSKEAQRKLFLDRLAAAKSKKTAAGTKSPASGPTSSLSTDTPPASASTVLRATESLFQVPGLSSSVDTAAQKPLATSSAGPKTAAPTIRLTPAELSRRMAAMREQAAQSAKAQVRPASPSRSISMSSLDYSQGQDSDSSDSIQSISDPAQSESHSTSQGNSRHAESELPARNFIQSSIPGLSAEKPSPASQPPISSYIASQVPQIQHNEHVHGTGFPRNPSTKVFQQSPRQYAAARAPAATVSPQQPIKSTKRSLDLPSNANGVTFRPNKRHFNQHSYENEVIIEISSDEDDDSEMEIDEHEGQPQFSHSITTARHRLPQKPKASNSLPARPNFTGRPHPQRYGTPNSAFPTPPSVSTPNPLDIQRQHDALEQKRKELQEQIEKKQQERKLKMETMGSSGQATPIPMKIGSPNNDTNTRLPSTSALPISSSLASFPPAHLSLPGTFPSGLLAEAKDSSPRPKTAEDKRKELNNHNMKLQAMQRQMEEMQAEIAREEAKTKALQLELEQQGVDTQGMTTEDMQEIKEDLIQVTEFESHQEITASPNRSAFREVAKTTPSTDEEEEGEEDGELIESSEDVLPEFRGSDTAFDNRKLTTVSSSIPMEEVATENSTQDDIEANIERVTRNDAVEEVHLISSSSSDSECNESAESAESESESEGYGLEPRALDEVDAMEVSDDDDEDIVSSTDSSGQAHVEALATLHTGQDDVSSDEDTGDSDGGSDSSAEESEDERNMVTATGLMDSSAEMSDEDELELANAITLDTERHNRSEDASGSGELTMTNPLSEVRDSPVNEYRESDHKTTAEPQLDAEYPPIDSEEDDLDLSDIYDPPALIANSFSEQVSHEVDANSGIGYGSTDDEDMYEPSTIAPAFPSAQSPSIKTSAVLNSTVDYQALPGINGSTRATGDGLFEPDTDVPLNNGELKEHDEAMHLDDGLEDGEISEPDDKQLGPDDHSPVQPPPFSIQEDHPAVTHYEVGVTGSQVDEVPEANIPDETIEDANGDSHYLASEELVEKQDANVASTPVSMSYPTAPDDDRQFSAEIDISAARSASLPITVIDETAPELQAVSNSSANSTAPSTVPSRITPFVPYESPLKMFKAYRFHSNFPKEVAGGITSLTYSHAIDPQQPLCFAEMAGKTCDDAQCHGQHFKSMQIPENQVLVQLGSLSENEGLSEEDRQRWSDGLRQVIADLRQEKISDTNVVASRIAQFRRDFFGDPSRVLNL